MTNVIFYEPREVSPKGLQKKVIPSKEALMKYIFPEEYGSLPVLSSLFPVPEPFVVLYPGCGADILTPLLYIERLFPSQGKIYLVFNDIENTLEMIKTILDDVGVTFEQKKNAIRFYWGDTLVTLTFWRGDIFQILPSLPPFTIYFERAFRIMKDADPQYEQKIVELLPAGGILISDSGFQQFPLERLPVDQKLSAYGEMVVGIKKRN